MVVIEIGGVESVEVPLESKTLFERAALITAELSTAMPEASGSVAWVDEAFGPFWAFQKGWLSWLSGVSDNTLYPILFLDCLVQLFSSAEHPSVLSADGGHPAIRMAFIMSITVSLTYFSYRGLDIVGTVAIVICLISLVPFAVFCVLGASKVDPARWWVGPANGIYGVDWRLLLNTFFWNINFWESAACFSGEVKNPGRNYPLGMSLAVLLVFVSLFIPVLIGTGASSAPYSAWTDGYFITLSREIIGPWMSYWLMFAAAMTNIGMFVAEMSSDSWQIAGMADRGILPSVLGIVCLAWMNFSQIIDMLNMLFCFGQAIEFCAFLHLRRVKPDMPRPFRVPIGLVGIAQSLIACVFLALLGAVVYYLLEHAKAKEWCHFEDKYEDFDQKLHDARAEERNVRHMEDVTAAKGEEGNKNSVGAMEKNSDSSSSHLLGGRAGN
eukprot:gene30655-37905_t